MNWRLQETITLSHEEAATKSLVLSKRVTVTDGPAFKRQRSIRRSKTLQENIVYLSLDRCHSFDRSFRPMKGKKALEIDLLSPFKDIEQVNFNLTSSRTSSFDEFQNAVADF